MEPLPSRVGPIMCGHICNCDKGGVCRRCVTLRFLFSTSGIFRIAAIVATFTWGARQRVGASKVSLDVMAWRRATELQSGGKGESKQRCHIFSGVPVAEAGP
jgi:hypothetical protein